MYNEFKNKGIVILLKQFLKYLQQLLQKSVLSISYKNVVEKNYKVTHTVEHLHKDNTKEYMHKFLQELLKTDIMSV